MHILKRVDVEWFVSTFPIHEVLGSILDKVWFAVDQSCHSEDLARLGKMAGLRSTGRVGILDESCDFGFLVPSFRIYQSIISIVSFFYWNIFLNKKKNNLNEYLCEYFWNIIITPHFIKIIDSQKLNSSAQKLCQKHESFLYSHKSLRIS